MTVTKTATTMVTSFVVLCSCDHSGLTSSVMAAVHASTWLSAVDMVAAKMDARMTPARNGLSTSIANNGNPSWAWEASRSRKIARHASPMMNMRAMNGVCQTKNQMAASLRSLSSLRVITRETTWGWPATPSPPRKNAPIHNVTPKVKSAGNRLTIPGSMSLSELCSPDKPPTSEIAT